ncbi:nickel insertion protein [Geofilum sp. OHC36d9]|uniref:nickel insertion protein n=1 Tax=Geofilum sp. OHC36d9 TaxID=3458413 RepID=UPI004034E392
MKQLYINPQGGFAGDMFAAALIDAGADKNKVTDAMLMAAEMIGRANVQHVKTSDNCSRMLIDVEHHHGHLSSHKAWHLLEHLFQDLKITPEYRKFGFQMLKELIMAEKEAHDNFDFNMESHHHDNHHHDNEEHEHDHNLNHHHHHGMPEAWLHEAQDILIDITGAVISLQDLQASTNAQLVEPVSYGGGSISFSHGTLKVPAPATQIMIKNNHIPVTAGPIETELFTPTGAAALSALQANTIVSLPDSISAAGQSRGTKDLPIPPLKIYLV